jgi:hypothetical protein
MDVHASPAALPERREFLGAFQGRFRRPEGTAALERYLDPQEGRGAGKDSCKIPTDDL